MGKQGSVLVLNNGFKNTTSQKARGYLDVTIWDIGKIMNKKNVKFALHN